LIRRKPYKLKKKREEVKLLDFVDSSKAIEGSSEEETTKAKVNVAENPEELQETSEVVDKPKKSRRKAKREIIENEEYEEKQDV
jgi:hypothetical protein